MAHLLCKLLSCKARGCMCQQLWPAAPSTDGLPALANASPSDVSADTPAQPPALSTDRLQRRCQASRDSRGSTRAARAEGGGGAELPHSLCCTALCGSCRWSPSRTQGTPAAAVGRWAHGHQVAQLKLRVAPHQALPAPLQRRIEQAPQKLYGGAAALAGTAPCRPACAPDSRCTLSFEV